VGGVSLFGEPDTEYAEVTRLGGPPTFIRCSPTRAQKREALIRVARDSYVCDDLTVEEFEATVWWLLTDPTTKDWKRA
jgi:hypothetical protein